MSVLNLHRKAVLVESGKLILSTIVLSAGLFGADRLEVGIWKLNVAKSKVHSSLSGAGFGCLRYDKSGI
jgi:hypothetical protein